MEVRLKYLPELWRMITGVHSHESSRFQPLLRPNLSDSLYWGRAGWKNFLRARKCANKDVSCRGNSQYGFERSRKRGIPNGIFSVWDYKSHMYRLNLPIFISNCRSQWLQLHRFQMLMAISIHFHISHQNLLLDNFLLKNSPAVFDE